MTPDDMEERLEAFICWLDPDNREPFSGSSLQIVADLRALLLDYQKRGRALEELRDSLIKDADAILAALGTKGADHD